jgi:AAA family ATP:ADP antiporter
MDGTQRLKLLRVAGLSLLGAVLMFTYAIARPATESLFLAAHTSKQLPTVWFLVAAAMIGAVYTYNHFLSTTDLLRLLGGVCAISAAALFLLIGLERLGTPDIYYALYVWKDVYVVVLVEIYYSYANSVFPIHTARWVYGLFGACGAAGGVIGNLSVGGLAARYGSASVLWFVPPALLAVYLFCLVFSKVAGVGTPLASEYRKGRMRDALKVVRRSSYLGLILLLIATVQVVATLLDYKYNSVLEAAYPLTDIRTGIIGKVYAFIDAGTFLFFALTGPILRTAGVPLTLAAIPCFLASGLAAFAAMPRFLLIAGVKIAGKCMDYTIFKASKEILYIPLTYAERTMGKSIVDMMTYRIAKGGASLLLMGLLAVGLSRLNLALMFALIAGWFAIAIIVGRRFRRKVSRHREMTTA